MIDRKELQHLIAELRRAGANVTPRFDGNGWFYDIQVVGMKGFGPHPMAPIAFGETARQVLHNLPYRFKCEDSDLFRVYYTRGSGLFCIQADRNFGKFRFAFYHCTKEGEPIHEIPMPDTSMFDMHVFPGGGEALKAS